MYDPIEVTSFTQFVERYQERIFRYIRASVQNTEVAQDLTSETFEKALGNWPPRFDNEVAQKRWIFRIASNTVTDHFRYIKQHNTLPLEDNIIHNQHKEDNYLTSVDIQSAFISLKRRDQCVLILRKIGYSNDEVAEIMEMKPKSVEMVFLRALKKLKKELKNQNNESTDGISKNNKKDTKEKSNKEKSHAYSSILDRFKLEELYANIMELLL